jgi:hypothetical protein
MALRPKAKAMGYQPCPFDGRGGLRCWWEAAHLCKRFVLVSAVGFVVLIRPALRAETMWWVMALRPQAKAMGYQPCPFYGRGGPWGSVVMKKVPWLVARVGIATDCQAYPSG